MLPYIGSMMRSTGWILAVSLIFSVPAVSARPATAPAPLVSNAARTPAHHQHISTAKARTVHVVGSSNAIEAHRNMPEQWESHFYGPQAGSVDHPRALGEAKFFARLALFAGPDRQGRHKVLDLATGSGRNIFPIAKIMKERGVDTVVEGNEISDTHAAQAEALFQQRGFSLKTHRRDWRELTRPPGEGELAGPHGVRLAILSGNSLTYLPKEGNSVSPAVARRIARFSPESAASEGGQEKALREIAKTLDGGGMAFIDERNIGLLSQYADTPHDQIPESMLNRHATGQTTYYHGDGVKVHLRYVEPRTGFVTLGYTKADKTYTEMHYHLATRQEREQMFHQAGLEIVGMFSDFQPGYDRNAVMVQYVVRKVPAGRAPRTFYGRGDDAASDRELRKASEGVLRAMPR
jgi:SAM-dependent methyltransferase